MTEETIPEIPKYTPHAMQLIAIDVLELHLVSEPSSEEEDRTSIEEGAFSLEHAHSEYDFESSKIGVRIRAEIGESEEHPLPFSIKVELLGIFSIDKDRFPIDKIDHWAAHNAPLILYPYLREQVYTLATRAGLKGLLLPLFEVPSFRPF